MGFVETVQDLVDQLEAADIEAAADRRDLNAPGVLVQPTALLAPTKLCGQGRLAGVFVLVVGDTGDAPALAALQTLYEAVLPVVAPVATTADRPFTREPNTDAPDDLPTLRVPFETPIT